MSSNESVTPAIAEITTTNLSVFNFCSTIETTNSIAATSATELPPNFKTCIYMYYENENNKLLLVKTAAKAQDFI
jgi:hypothetical protein